MTAPVRNIAGFLDILKRDGELAVVDAPVSADQEIAEIHRRVIDAGGPALSFTNVQGSNFPVVTNMFGTGRRTERAFGKRPVEFVRRAAKFAMEALPPTPGKLWQFRDLLMSGAKIGMKNRPEAPVAEVMEFPNLEKLPLLKLWPEDGGHFVTLPLVYTEDPETKKPNLGMYRMQRYNARETGMHWQIGKGGGFHYHRAEEMGKPLPVSVFIGGPPALILSAIAPLPENVPELLLASLLLGEKLSMHRTGKWMHRLVAEAEFALVGQVAPKKRRPEGPFGDHYGYYSLTHDYPVFRCKAVYRRRKAIYPATVVGKPRQEDFFIGDYLQELLSPLFPLVMPSVRDLWSYGETGFHSLAAAVVRDRYGREALQSAFRILGEGQLSLTKFLLLTDTPRDLRDFRGLLEHVLERANFETDLYIFSHLSMDTLDYTGPAVNKGSKGVLVGLGDKKRELPREFSGTPPKYINDARVFCGGVLVVSGPPYRGENDDAQKVARAKAFADWPLIILCDDVAKACENESAFLWTVFTRFEPAADICASRTTVNRAHLSLHAPIVIDARVKPWHPGEVECDPAVAEKVSRRWREYFPKAVVSA